MADPNKSQLPPDGASRTALAIGQVIGIGTGIRRITVSPQDRLLCGNNALGLTDRLGPAMPKDLIGAKAQLDKILSEEQRSAPKPSHPKYIQE